jgi:hypothetical protein
MPKCPRQLKLLLSRAFGQKVRGGISAEPME